MRTIIISFAVGYSFDDIKYFIHSCHLYAPDSEVVVFAGKNIETLRRKCSMYPHVRFIRYRQSIAGVLLFRLIRRLPLIVSAYAKFLRAIRFQRIAPSAALDLLTVPLVQFMVKRFFLIKAKLPLTAYDFVMLSDIRDVVIQANPFSNLTSDTLMTGIEPITNEECDQNRTWLHRTYPPGKYHALKSRNVACAGVIIGSAKAIDLYLNEMIREVYAQLDRIIDMLGADQAIHIKLFYEELNSLKKEFHANGSGTIATLHYSDLSEFHILDGHLVNHSGHIPAVIHQYDRHVGLSKYLRHHVGRTMPTY